MKIEDKVIGLIGLLVLVISAFGNSKPVSAAAKKDLIELSDESIYKLMTNNMMVVKDRRLNTTRLTVQNPYSETRMSIELTEVDTVDVYTTLHYFLD